MSILLFIVLVGILVGWLAGPMVRGTGFGIVGDICAGIVGAISGALLLEGLGIRGDIVTAIISAAIGAFLLLAMLRLVRGRGRW